MRRAGWLQSTSIDKLWGDKAPIRSDLFGIERLEHHAVSLAAAQPISQGRPVAVSSLLVRVKDNADALLVAYRSGAQSLDAGQPIPPAAEWLLDNFHIVEQQLRQIEDDLPPGYYRHLPKLADGPLAGYPRVLGLAWAYVAHTDSLLSETALLRFVQAYQTVQPLTIGELWAVAITLRIVLIENMRRLAEQITEATRLRQAADDLVDRVLASSASGGSAHTVLAGLDGVDLSEIMVAQVAKRLRGTDPAETPLSGWLEDRLRHLGLSVETVVAHAQARQGASNVTMRNIVASMRRLSELDWADFFEASSLIEARLRAASGYREMDFATRNSYRTAIEMLARHSGHDEAAVAEAALTMAQTGDTPAARDPGFALLGAGRDALSRALGYAPPLRLTLGRQWRRMGLPGYLGAIALAAVLFLTAALWLTGLHSAALILSGVWLAVEAGTALVNLLITRLVGPKPLPGLSLEDGIPANLRTLVAVPVLLANVQDLMQQIEQLEVHHLSSIGGALHYALLSDGPDATEATTPLDTALITTARAAIAKLNATYPCDDGDRFLFLHRERQWNPSEGVWMGWERKRGKLIELNHLLRGAADTSFLPGAVVPQGVKFVITLDADTRILRDTVRRLIGKMAHPLNRPVIDPATQRVTSGYGILQPQVTPALPLGLDGSLYQRISSSPGGIEPYAAACSDVYQDLFSEGSFTGKGIYDVDAFMAAIDGRVPDNTMLSHDLFEGSFARAGLVSDIQVIEDFLARQDVDARRQHRWVRGDWQLLPWISGKRKTTGGISAVNRWKMIDNLRRSLLAPMTLLSLLAGWLLPLPQALAWTAAVLVLLALPRLIALPLAILPGRAGITARSHFQALLADVKLAFAQIALTVAFLADTSALMLDAIARTAMRLRWGTHLLEWLTAAQSSSGGLPSYARFYLLKARGVALGLFLCGLVVVLNAPIWPLALTFAAIWLTAPAIARLVSLPRMGRTAPPLTTAESTALRLIARRTWRYFEAFVTEANHFLPPDNFQETPRPVVATRTSPTNIGLYLLSVTVAKDMGWIGQAEAVTRLEQTLTTMQQLQRFRGHLYNWYDTSDLRLLDPAYVSSVDSGNLAGHLIAVAQACQEWQTRPAAPDLRGLHDALALALEALSANPDPRLSALLEQVANHPARATEAAILAEAHAGAGSELAFWTRAIAASHASQLADPVSPERLRAVGDQARQFAMDMEFGFLMQPEKKLLSIGFSVSTNTLDANCYDLLASEARLASLFAIAKGDVETRHWFRLGRGATPIGAGSALISWSGSMFEYLMPSLVMRAPAGSVLEETNRRIVEQQQAYAASLSMPWGISESAYNARDLEMTYQYSNFGVPGLGLKRGLSENRVLAPYATGLATMVDAKAALQNYAALADLGAEGRFGFYEALDFTASRLPEGATNVVVRSFMAHHQGMTITAIANVLHDGLLRDRFHAEPIIQAVELLLQERVPRDVPIAPPRAKEVLVAAVETLSASVVRHFESPVTVAPTAHLLSNGSYGVTLTPTGAGFSRWRDLAVTRWRADATQAQHGGFIYLRDVRSGGQWSAGVLPTGRDPGLHRAVFCEHHAAFTHTARHLLTHTEVVVSAEDDAEARRVTLTNTGRHPREIDVTSYAELVLAAASADLSHPAFSKLFVVTDYLPELGVLIATRRKRSPSDPEVWAAHLAVVEGAETAPLQYETDRAKFIGRGQMLSNPAAAETPLSGTIGTVLDPVFSLRRRVLIPGGGRVRVTFWTMIADTPEALLDLVERHRDSSAFGRAVTLAWTQTQVQLRHLGISATTASDFQRLAGMLVRGDGRLRASAAQIRAGAGPQSDLWALGVSGDLPIVLFLISDAEDIGRLQEVLAAAEYWQMRQLAVDLVILNDRASSYVQDLQIAIDAAVRSSQARPGKTGTAGKIYTLRADMTPPETRARLVAAAAMVLIASRGSIGAQLDLLPATPAPAPQKLVLSALPSAPITPPELEFFNGTGGFDLDGREYVTVLQDGQTSPAPWINVIANPSFGFQVSADGSGFTWAENSRENQITPWSNDPVSDPAGEAIYLQDLETGQIWTPTALPIRSNGSYIARHGFGYSRFQHTANGIEADMMQFVPMDAPVKITQLTLRNTSDRDRRLSVTGYAEWVLGTSRGATATALITEIDAETGAILVRNPRGMAFPGRVAFADLGAETTSRSADRAEILGRGGSMAAPARLSDLSGNAGPRLDPCAALQREITLAPEQSVDVTFLLGQTTSLEEARALILATRARDLTAVLDEVKAWWGDLLGTVQVRSPDRAMDIMLNGWLMYQSLACRIWARAGFYQASGAYGFRDQLQDGMALTALRPEMTRAHLLRAAARQFPEGDVQHWWLPHSGQGVRTRISDDRVWLSYAVAQYISVSGDATVLDEILPFLEGADLRPGEHDNFFQPGISDTTATLFEHCARGLDQAIELTGADGMPLIGTGDWNDGMNRVGEAGQGTSVWLGWLLIATIRAMRPFVEARDPTRAARWQAHAESVRLAIERDGWDGAWYRRGRFDDGSLLGSSSSAECQIDSIAQSWAVLSGAAVPERAATAMQSMTDRLIKPDAALLFTPPFDHSMPDPGYIKGYPPGLRENGGQYSHAAMWAVLAQTRLGNGDAAGALFALLNPINHALTPAEAARYKVEPYVIAADVYSVAPHEGRGGWTWYTGSAAWMYRAGIEGLLGLTRQGDTLRFAPCFPKAWPQVELRLTLGPAPCVVKILNPHGLGAGLKTANLNGKDIACEAGVLTLALDRLEGALILEIG
ncbi:GH36-type glycosyl hydrolase domain-containing protein [Cypionkella sp.]|uniref:GH36-type glycosyl hydrolase domain-containing protein n=1 Tax=Cypionkella sp. TaxID=2811411 RepID=UPI0027177659|nr:glucoamylase family protein [Cypionkella sp.]MDO8984651.1 glucoamylase family protein [Cypionkella sp.]MDP2051159.1 glucoamylase family protein [Cypionkella sp.]